MSAGREPFRAGRAEPMRFHFLDAAAFVARPYAEAVRDHDRHVVIGLRRPDGEILLDPDPGRQIELGDQLVTRAQPAGARARTAPRR